MRGENRERRMQGRKRRSGIEMEIRREGESFLAGIPRENNKKLL